MAWLNLCGVIRKSECSESYESLKVKLDNRYPASEGYWVRFVPQGEDWENVYVMHDTGAKSAVDLNEEDEVIDWPGKKVGAK